MEYSTRYTLTALLAFRSLSQASYRARAGLVAAVVVTALSACNLPFGFDLPTTRSLESGATGTLIAADSFEITGSYRDGSKQWSIDLQLSRPDSEHVTVTTADVKLEAIILGNNAYFRGQQFLSAHMAKRRFSDRRSLSAPTTFRWMELPPSSCPAPGETCSSPRRRPIECYGFA